MSFPIFFTSIKIQFDTLALTSWKGKIYFWTQLKKSEYMNVLEVFNFNIHTYIHVWLVKIMDQQNMCPLTWPQTCVCAEYPIWEFNIYDFSICQLQKSPYLLIITQMNRAQFVCIGKQQWPLQPREYKQ